MRKQESKWWEQAARSDWSAAESLRRDGNLSVCAFLLQQASEEMLKAVCVAHKRPAFTHVCVDLLANIRSMGIEVPEEVFSAARRLDPHYLNSRYPNRVSGPPSKFYDETIISELYECAKMLMSFAESQLVASRHSHNPLDGVHTLSPSHEAELGLDSVHREWIDNLVAGLQRKIDLHKVILFGSRAEDDHTTWSDYDLCVISPDFAGMAPFRRAEIVLECWNGKRGLDALCYTPDEFAQSDWSIVEEIKRAGVVLWPRDWSRFHPFQPD